MMTHRERLVEALTFGRPDRLPVWQLFGLMPGVLERWTQEGMPPVGDQQEALRFFGLDPQPWAVPAHCGPYPRCEVVTHEDTPEYRIFTDDFGRTNKLIKGAATLPLPLDFPVAGAHDWAEWKSRFAFNPGRMAEDWSEGYSRARQDGLAVSLNLMGLYHFPRQLMGDLNLSLAFYDQPDLVRDILETYCELLIAMGESVFERAEVDVVFLSEDYAYRGGAFISPAMFREFLSPYYRKITGYYRDKGVKVIAVDSDGRVDEIIPLLLEVGVNCLYPFEVQAGNDIAAIRKQYGEQLAIIGGIDKLAIAKGKGAIDRELDKRLPAMASTGGYIASLDHRVTVETSFESYSYYVREAKRRLGSGKNADERRFGEK